MTISLRDGWRNKYRLARDGVSTVLLHKQGVNDCKVPSCALTNAPQVARDSRDVARGVDVSASGP